MTTQSAATTPVYYNVTVPQVQALNYFGLGLPNTPSSTQGFSTDASAISTPINNAANIAHTFTHNALLGHINTVGNAIALVDGVLNGFNDEHYETILGMGTGALIEGASTVLGGARVVTPVAVVAWGVDQLTGATDAAGDSIHEQIVNNTDLLKLAA